MSVNSARVLAELRRFANPANVAGMARFGIAWAKDFECWADCDGLCIHLFRKTRFAHEQAVAWSGRREELVKRAGFTMTATLREEATDERHNVKKGVNWALRQIGKRNPILNREAIRTAKVIRAKDSRAARWIAGDALRELQRWKPE
jgi:3-methyladenine DNA glycosylase AlkD